MDKTWNLWLCVQLLDTPSVNPATAEETSQEGPPPLFTFTAQSKACEETLSNVHTECEE